VHLHAEFAIEFAADRIVIDHDAHHLAVEDVNQDVAAHDEKVMVPIVAAVNVRRKLLRIAERADDFGNLAGFDACDLSAQGEK